MTSHDDSNRRLTFSQREGKAEIIVPKLGELSVKFRNAAWKIIGEYFAQITCKENQGNYVVTSWMDENSDSLWSAFIRSYYHNALNYPHDQWLGISGPADIGQWWRGVLLDEKESDKVITLLEYLFQYDAPEWDDLKASLKQVFDEHTLYWVDDVKHPVCIMPAFSPESRLALMRSMQTLFDGKKTSAAGYLHRAGDDINTHDWGDSVRNSIDAVESVARSVVPGTQKLGEALNKLKNGGLIEHSTLLTALEKLYGYTNIQPGIRHPVVSGDKSKSVGRDEAILMLGACASFAAYLTAKEQQLNARSSGETNAT